MDFSLHGQHMYHAGIFYFGHPCIIHIKPNTFYRRVKEMGL